MKNTDKSKEKKKAKGDTDKRLVPSDVAAEQAIYASKRDMRSSWAEIIAANQARSDGSRFSYSD